jgi:hypothetical protein
MTRLLTTAALVALLLPYPGTASRVTAGDGTLSVRDGRGVFRVNAKGGVIGSFVVGKVIIVDPIDADGTGPIISLSSDDLRRERGDTTTIVTGTKVRFRLIGGTFRIKVIGRGVNLSVVGKGFVTLNGEGSLDDGSYSLNGEEYLPVPSEAVTLPLNPST